MKKVDFKKYSPQVMEQMSKNGVFLNTKQGDRINTMTIGWGTIGVFWGKPVFTVAVRVSRHTYDLINGSGEFTVSVPMDDKLKKALAFCGSKSGRSVDKFAECGISSKDGISVNSPCIEECALHYECKVIYKQSMEPGLILSDAVLKFYSGGDFHMVFYGEIQGCYLK